MPALIAPRGLGQKGGGWSLHPETILGEIIGHAESEVLTRVRLSRSVLSGAAGAVDSETLDEIRAIIPARPVFAVFEPNVSVSSLTSGGLWQEVFAGRGGTIVRMTAATAPRK